MFYLNPLQGAPAVETPLEPHCHFHCLDFKKTKGAPAVETPLETCRHFHCPDFKKTKWQPVSISKEELTITHFLWVIPNRNSPPRGS